jgi:glycosyltransferase involved in cell wall biosynthesis
MKKNIGVITLPLGKSGGSHLKNVVEILDPGQNDITIITGNCGIDEDLQITTRNRIIGLNIVSPKNSVLRVSNYLYVQAWIAYAVYKFFRHVDASVIYLGNCLIIPKIVLKLMRIPTVEIYAGSPINTLSVERSRLILPMRVLTHLSNELSDIIILYTPSLESEWQFRRWRNKIRYSPVQHVDFDLFHRTNDLPERGAVVGYVGRLSEEKGILNLARAIPNIVRKMPGVEFLIVGDGILKETIEDIVEEENVRDHVSLAGWADRGTLPGYLNRMRVLVVPSYTEGLPNVVLEAMACGTPVLVSPVGSIPDVIIDGKNGFLLPDNTPESIENGVLRIFEREDLESVSIRAETLVRDTFSMSAARSRIQRLLSSTTR